MKKKDAYSYIRMSTDIQLKGDSLRRQKQLSTDYANKYNFNLIKNLEDIGLSAYTNENVSKGELGIFITAVKAGEIKKGSILLIENLDRLSRLPVFDATALFVEIIQHDVEIHVLSKKQILNKQLLNEHPMLFNDVVSSFTRANDESDTKSKRGLESWSNKRNNIDVKILTKQSPFWLKAKPDNSGFDVIENYKNIVLKVFDLSINRNWGSFRITRYLNENLEKYPPPPKANRWGKSTITKLLNNPAVHGEFTPHKLIDGVRHPTSDVLIDYFPEIISEKMFQLAQLGLESRKISGGGRVGQNTNIFSKKIVCGRCKGAVHYQTKNKKKEEFYLTCYNTILANNCNAPSWSYKDFTKSFFMFATEFDFEKMLQNSSTESERVKLLENESLLEASIEEENIQFNAFLNELKSTSEAVKEKAKPQIEELVESINEKEVQLEDVRKTLKKLDNVNDSMLSQQLQFTLMNHTISDINSSRELREKISIQIDKIVDEIVLFTPLHSYDISSGFRENLSPNVVKYLLSIMKESEIDEYFKTKSNEKLNFYERYYIIKFRNGFKKTVYPAIEQSYKFDSSNMHKLIFETFDKKIRKQEETKSPKAKYKRKKSN